MVVDLWKQTCPFPTPQTYVKTGTCDPVPEPWVVFRPIHKFPGIREEMSAFFVHLGALHRAGPELPQNSQRFIGDPQLRNPAIDARLCGNFKSLMEVYKVTLNELVVVQVKMGVMRRSVVNCQENPPSSTLERGFRAQL